MLPLKTTGLFTLLDSHTYTYYRDQYNVSLRAQKTL